ncbi:hydantoinase/oxoprolinase family protein [Salipiger abyssi]|uniref:hydantoinase/oxoprolinase family protein n=1 Tax=Salipiger abyssi TaxID=1250539 RepID=UPI001A8E55E9|nr:hydantoinase/oxoprolinase family protein [Salipiger abyssi]MBN9885870.1 hydantoinase/oxoprolinase family protein [Salipiger abyssi]
MSHPIDLKIAVDIGGTFTDGIAEDEATGRIWVGKCLTTPDDPGEGVSSVVAQLLAKVGGGDTAAQVREVVHGTTLVTNTLIERKGVPTALIATAGTRDTLDIRREIRYDLYDLDLELPEPLVPDENRFELTERLDAKGTPLTPIDEAELAALAEELKAHGVEAVAVCLLHGHVNGAHEERVRDALAEALPDMSVSISSGVARELREYERMSTTAANAYVQPLVERYMGMLSQRMADAGISGSLRIMLSSGGFTSAEAAAETPILLLESGPAAGVLSAVNAGLLSEQDYVLAFDMGGTTAKACVAVNGAPDIAHSFEAARVRRFKKGSGLPILIPSIDLIEIGAGGGSLAGVDALGLLKVGPQSAGSVPGPVCYGRGGSRPAVTDADLVLGYLDPGNFLGGEMALRKNLAEEALDELGSGIGLNAQETAAGIVNIVNENMAAAARVHIAEKGHDPRRFTMVATGGAGPVHAVEVARRLGISTLLCPIAAGAGSCLGLLAAPARADRSWSRPGLLDALDWNEVASVLAGLHADAVRELTEAGANPDALGWELTVEMRYAGQGSTMNVRVPYADIGPQLAPVLKDGFEAAYRDLYGTTVPSASIQAVTWRLSGSSSVRAREFVWSAVEEGAAPAPKTRPIYVPERERYEEVSVYERYALPAGSVLAGPCIIEERESTFVVSCDARVEILPDLTIKAQLGVKP